MRQAFTYYRCSEPAAVGPVCLGVAGSRSTDRLSCCRWAITALNDALIDLDYTVVPVVSQQARWDSRAPLATATVTCAYHTSL